MRALCFDGKTARLVRNHPKPMPGPGEALLRIGLAGICNTDLEILRGYADFTGVLGHEFVATVEASEDPAWVGRRVVGEINVGCGQCAMCRRGWPNHCLQRSAVGIHQRDGAFAEYLTLPLSNLHPVPPEVSDQQAVFTEPLAAALEILEQVSVRPRDRVLVLGDGKLGLLVAQVLRLTGCDLSLVGHHEDHLALARGWGVRAFLEGKGYGDLFDVVVECTGSPQGFVQALHLTRPRGTLVLKSTYARPVPADLVSVVVDEITLAGSRCGPFDGALRLLEAGLVDVAPLVNRVFPLDEGPEALQYAARRGVLKVLLEVS